MRIRFSSPSLRYAAAGALALSVFGSAFGQVALPAKPTVYNNPQPPNDPRVGLKGGVTDAAIAQSGMKLVLNIPKPPWVCGGDDSAGEGSSGGYSSVAGACSWRATAAASRAGAGVDQLGPGVQGPVRDCWNYNGFNIYDASNPLKTKLVTSVMCRDRRATRRCMATCCSFR